MSSSSMSSLMSSMEAMSSMSSLYPAMSSMSSMSSLHPAMSSTSLIPAMVPRNTFSPIFTTIRKHSIESIEKVKEGGAASSGPPLNLAALTTQQREQLFYILSMAKNFSYDVKEILTDAFNTIKSGYPSLDLTEDQRKTAAGIVLEVLKSLVGSIRRFTDESLESIGRKASEVVIEVSLQLQELEMALEDAKVSARFYNAIFSALVMGFAALLAPVATLAVAPFLQRFDLVWEDFMEKPIVDKLKVFQAVLFNIHSAIAAAGKIQDSVYSLSRHAFRAAEGLQPRVVMRGYIKLEEGVEEGAFFLGPFSEVGDDVTKRLMEMEKVEEGAFLSGPFSEVGDDVTKPLMEMEKVVAAALDQVEMAAHEIEQLIQTLILPLQQE